MLQKIKITSVSKRNIKYINLFISDSVTKFFTIQYFIHYNIVMNKGLTCKLMNYVTILLPFLSVADRVNKKCNRSL